MVNAETQHGGTALDSIKERIAKIQELPLDSHIGEYEAIHSALESALSTVEGL
jgi:hypothetical protein